MKQQETEQCFSKLLRCRDNSSKSWTLYHVGYLENEALWEKVIMNKIVQFCMRIMQLKIVSPIVEAIFESTGCLIIIETTGNCKTMNNVGRLKFA